VTIDEIRKRIELIKTEDNESAHYSEDTLYKDVLAYIATGNATNAQELAYEALKAADLSYTRWYA